MCTSRTLSISTFERVADAGGMCHRDPEKRSQWYMYFVRALSLEGSGDGGGGPR